MCVCDFRTYEHNFTKEFYLLRDQPIRHLPMCRTKDKRSDSSCCARRKQFPSGLNESVVQNRLGSFWFRTTFIDSVDYSHDGKLEDLMISEVNSPGGNQLFLFKWSLSPIWLSIWEPGQAGRNHEQKPSTDSTLGLTTRGGKESVMFFDNESTKTSNHVRVTITLQKVALL